MPVGKQCDLVIFKGTEKLLLGRASVNEVGHIEAQISKTYKPEIMEQVFPELEQYELRLVKKTAPLIASGDFKRAPAPSVTVTTTTTGE